jgi:SNF2 family DNA or RNA helicase
MTSILHATWLPQRKSLFVWGEYPELPERKSRKRKKPPHPYQTPAETLRGRLHGTAYTEPLLADADQLTEETVTIWLPTIKNMPLPSPEMSETGAIPTPDGEPQLSAWQVTGLLLPINPAIDLLLALAKVKDRASDVQAWHLAALLAMEMVADQQVIPALEREGFQLRASWRPRPTPAMAERLTTLSRSLPPLCRAVVEDAEQALTPRMLLNDFLETAVDATIRDIPFAPSYDASTPGGKWLEALLEDDPIVQLKGTEADKLFASWQEWAGQGQMAGNEAFRITFRLEPPERQEDPWHVSYLLQATDDPSLIVPGATIWREQGAEFTYLERRFDQPHERMLKGLGHASRIFPPLEESLRSAAPDRAQLTLPQAFTFLKEAAPMLEQEGYGVLVPSWWGKDSPLKARAKAKSKGPSKANEQATLSLQKIIQFTWHLSLGDEPLDFAEFEKLVALKMPLVQMRGQWIALDPESSERMLKLLKQSSGKMSFAEMLRLDMGNLGADLPEGVEFEGVEAEGWVAEALEGLRNTQKLDLLPQPEALHATLRPYQVRGYSWLDFMRRYGLGACLADDMGLGKCLVGTSLVDVNGTLRPIATLWDDYATASWFDGEGYWADSAAPLWVQSIDAQGTMTTAPVQRLYRQWVHETLRRVTLADGNQITITQQHPLLTSTGWSTDFQVGDYVCVPARTHWQGEPTDADLITFLAWQIAEGYELNDRATVVITQKDRTRLESLLEALQRIGTTYNLKLNAPAIHEPPGRAAVLSLNSVAYRQFLKDRGYQWGKRSADKVIPDFLMQADLAGVRLFLRNYFDAEASVILNMRSIEISSASPLLMQQLAALLRRFGIWLRISYKQKRATNGSGIARPYVLGTFGGHAIRHFLREIGFGDAQKQQRLETICTTVQNTNVEGIPASSIVAQMVHDTGLPVRHFGVHNTVYLDGLQPFSHVRLERVVSSCDAILSGASEQQYRQQTHSRWTESTLTAYAPLDYDALATQQGRLRHMLAQEVFYCKITAIEEVVHSGWVYDLEVEQQHNFVANNILCHNTIQTIALILREHEQNTTTAPALLVCPTSVIGNWQREIQRFAPALRTLVHQGADRRQGKSFRSVLQDYEVVLTSYPLLNRDRDTLDGVDWSMVVLDEAQNIKNPSAKQTQAARALKASTRIALTGTPVENRLTELWSIMTFLNPGYLGSEDSFKKQFARPIERTNDPQATEQLKQLTSPFILRRLKTDKTIITDLPEKIEMNVYCTLTQEQATLYQATVEEGFSLVKEAESENDQMKRRGMVLSLLMKLKQICNHPAQFLKDGSSLEGRSGKIERLTEMLEEIHAIGDRALIFTQFSEMGHMLQRYLSEMFYEAVLFLHGETPAKQRDAMVRQFQSPRGPTVFILSLKAGGTGINLTNANHVFHFDRWWNPAVENQATDRAFRIGQTRNVQVHKFVCSGTLEDHINDLIEHKRSLAESVLGTGESWLTELSTDQLHDLITLKQTA